MTSIYDTGDRVEWSQGLAGWVHCMQTQGRCDRYGRLTTTLPPPWACKHNHNTRKSKNKTGINRMSALECVLSLFAFCSVYRDFQKQGGSCLNKQGPASLVGDFAGEKRRREKKWEVFSMHQAMQYLVGTLQAFLQWQLTHEPTHGGFPRLPPIFLTTGPSHPTRSLCLTRLLSFSPLPSNKCQMTNKYSVCVWLVQMTPVVGHVLERLQIYRLKMTKWLFISHDAVNCINV